MRSIVTGGSGCTGLILPRGGLFEVLAPQHLILRPFTMLEVGDPLDPPVRVVFNLGDRRAFATVKTQAVGAALLVEDGRHVRCDAGEGWFLDGGEQLAGEVRVQAQRCPRLRCCPYPAVVGERCPGVASEVPETVPAAAGEAAEVTGPVEGCAERVSEQRGLPLRDDERVNDNMTAWLRKQIETRMALAREASPKTDGHWWRRETVFYVNGTLAPVGPLYAGEMCRDEDGGILGGEYIVVYDEGAPSDAQFEHIAANDPRDTSARCEAELAILDEHASDGDARWPECIRCADTHPANCDCGWEAGGGEHRRAAHAYPCRTVRLLASSYRHRDGYKEEWKP
jgi:Family of unknown function (DUF6221)